MAHVLGEGLWGCRERRPSGLTAPGGELLPLPRIGALGVLRHRAFQAFPGAVGQDGVRVGGYIVGTFGRGDQLGCHAYRRPVLTLDNLAYRGSEPVS